MISFISLCRQPTFGGCAAQAQNPRNDHIDAAKISARRLMDLLYHFIGRLFAERVT
jgi:hypothetical protein